MKTLPPQYTGPGLLDLQVNGYAGFDFNGDPKGWRAGQLRRLASTLARRGVLAVLPTLVTDAPAAMVARAARYGRLLKEAPELERHFPRLHVEGPFLSPADGPRGAHARRHCTSPRKHPDLFDRLQEASGGRVGLLTLAPEVPGALELIARCAREGVVAAIGHTQASGKLLNEAVAAGARLSTHLGNGSHQMLPRLDNYVQAQLAEDRLWASFIPDGHHMPFTTLKNFIRCKTPARSILVTDAIVAAEMGPGRYPLGRGVVVVSQDGRAARPGESNLAGSALTLDAGILHAYLHCDVTFSQAWAMASTHPARLLGLAPLETVTVTVTKKGFLRQTKKR